MNKVRNHISVRDSGSFSVYLFATETVGNTFNYYPIAKLDTGIILTASQFTPGTIQSFLVTAIDVVSASASTRYKITLQPQTAIPPNSEIVITFPSTIFLKDGASYTTNNTISGSTQTFTNCAISNNFMTITYPWGISATTGYTQGSSAFSIQVNAYGTNPKFVQDAGTFNV